MIFSLTIHADYECRHAGACCRAGWPIPIDPALQHELDDARAQGRLIVPLRELSADACVFYETAHPDAPAGGGRCAIHRQLGASYKPPSCRHFPRVALLDRRGVSITLSHYCPTAAGMLFRTDVALAITDAPRAFPPEAEYEGLDARDVMPPLLRPGMLWDFEGYSAWERHAIALFARDGMAPEQALDLLARVAEELERWNPSDGPLRDEVARRFAAARGASPTSSRWGGSRVVVNRYLAARLFASWVPYRSDHLGALVHDLAQSHLVLQEEAARAGATLLDAIGATDLRIVHAGC